MRTILLPLLAVFFGCATKPDPRLIAQQQLAARTTTQLQLRRQQLAESISIWHVGWYDYLQHKEKDRVEMELLRRFEAGDAAAELKPLPARK